MTGQPQRCETPGCEQRATHRVDWRGVTWNCELHAEGIRKIAEDPVLFNELCKIETAEDYLKRMCTTEWLDSLDESEETS